MPTLSRLLSHPHRNTTLLLTTGVVLSLLPPLAALSYLQRLHRSLQLLQRTLSWYDLPSSTTPLLRAEALQTLTWRICSALPLIANILSLLEHIWNVQKESLHLPPRKTPFATVGCILTLAGSFLSYTLTASLVHHFQRSIPHYWQIRYIGSACIQLRALHTLGSATLTLLTTLSFFPSIFAPRPPSTNFQETQTEKFRKRGNPDVPLLKEINLDTPPTHVSTLV